MKGWTSKIQTWQLQKDQRELKRWERTRADGHALYIINGALSSGLYIIFMNDIIEGAFGIPLVISVHLIGAVGAWFLWRKMESKYQRALLKAQQQQATAAPTNILGLRDS